MLFAHQNWSLFFVLNWFSLDSQDWLWRLGPTAIICMKY